MGVMGCWVAAGHTPLIHWWGYVPLPRINKLKKPTNWPFLGHKDRFIKWQHPSAPLINCTGEGDRAAHTASGDMSLQCHWLGDTVGILRKPRGHEKIPELPPLTLFFFLLQVMFIQNLVKEIIMQNQNDLVHTQPSVSHSWRCSARHHIFPGS